MHTEQDVITDATVVEPKAGAASNLAALFSTPATDATDALRLERKGRNWLLWSFLLCPCHLPWTLSILAAVFASTSLGVYVREHAWVAGTIVTIGWVVGTGYGFHLIRRAQRSGGGCEVRGARAS